MRTFKIFKRKMGIFQRNACLQERNAYGQKRSLPSREEYNYAVILFHNCTLKLVYTDSFKINANSKIAVVAKEFSEIIPLGIFATVLQIQIMGMKAVGWPKNYSTR